MPKPETVYILGAGFSCNAALPSQAQITGQLLDHETLNGPRQINAAITAVLSGFLHDVFDLWDLKDGCPELEDIFTFVDLSVQSEHFLGPRYTPKKLRALRRLLSHRIFQVLEKSYRPSPDITQLLAEAREREDCAFITLNWDTVLEKHLRLLGLAADYKCEARPLKPTADAPACPVYKLHGSANWAYCDNCKCLFYDPALCSSFDDQLFLFPCDFALLGYDVDPHLFNPLPCPRCGISHMSTHIVTFSYLKDFRTNYFTGIWHGAELLLQQADHWIFIGYSLPRADYQFRHVLKAAQLQLGRSGRPKLSVITKHDPRRFDPAITRYAKFFGSQLLPQNIYHAGIAEYLARGPHPRPSQPLNS